MKCGNTFMVKHIYVNNIRSGQSYICLTLNQIVYFLLVTLISREGINTPSL